MSNSYFSFKQFTIHQEHCAMKVGTDGVLLGAWAPVDGARHVLDVGTGTGLIALQLAQRCPQAHIVAVEVEEGAARQAAANAAASPWAERIRVECIDFRCYETDCAFDLIVSNPPYFVDALKCPSARRSMARHAGSLNYGSLFARATCLLAPQGRLALIVPAEAEGQVTEAARRHRLHLHRRTDVYTKPGKPCRRILFLFGTGAAPCHTDSLCIEQAGGGYTPEYTALTGDFYLKM